MIIGAPMAKSYPTLELSSTAASRGSTTTEDSLPYIFQGENLSGKDFVELERRLRTTPFCQKAELYVAGKFTSNNRPLNPGKTFTIQYLTHSTHSPQLDLIWDGRTATFTGQPKLASLHLSPRDYPRRPYARVATWKAVSGGLRQLQIHRCQSCSHEDHQCGGHCCRLGLSEYMNVGDNLSRFSELTCKKGMSLQEGQKTCHGERCRVVERVLPGSYLWLGVATLEDETDPVDAATFLAKWTRRDIYGTHSFAIDIHALLSNYKAQVARGKNVILRCGGTLLYYREVCYVVIVTYMGDQGHDGLPPVTSIGDTSRCNWTKLLNDVGAFTKSGYPSFLPHHVKDGDKQYWDHVVFAVSLPHGATLRLDSESLCGKGPLGTNHSGLCHRFKAFSFDGSDLVRCKEEELLYQMHHHRAHEDPLTATEVNEFLLQFDPEHKNRLRAVEICVNLLDASSVLELKDILDTVRVGPVAEEHLLKAFKLLLQRVRQDELVQVHLLLDSCERTSHIRGQAEEAVLAVLQEKLLTITSAQASSLVEAFRHSTEAFKVVCRHIQDFGEIDKVLEVVPEGKSCRVIARQELQNRFAPTLVQLQDLRKAMTCLSIGETDEHFERMKRTVKTECKALLNACTSNSDLPLVKTTRLASSSESDALTDTDASDSEEVEFDDHSSPLLGRKRSRYTLSDTDCSSDEGAHQSMLTTGDNTLTDVTDDQHNVSVRGDYSDSNDATTVYDSDE